MSEVGGVWAGGALTAAEGAAVAIGAGRGATGAGGVVELEGPGVGWVGLVDGSSGGPEGEGPGVPMGP